MGPSRPQCTRSPPTRAAHKGGTDGKTNSQRVRAGHQGPSESGAATSGGVTSARDVHNYSAPQGPTNIMESQSPGLHGSNSGNTRQPTGKSSSGGPGIGGTNHGCCGSQGRH